MLKRRHGSYKLFSLTHINIDAIPLLVRTSTENEKCAPDIEATFSFSVEVRTNNGIASISIRVSAFFAFSPRPVYPQTFKPKEFEVAVALLQRSRLII